jgi:hypothetical protein
MNNKKHKKQLKRNKKKKDKPSQKNPIEKKIQKDLGEQVGLFNKLPTTCSACSTDFPKTREAHMSWRVVVKAEEQKVTLFCPTCTTKTQELINTINPEREQSE